MKYKRQTMADGVCTHNGIVHINQAIRYRINII